jgi:hypothetical protein
MGLLEKVVAARSPERSITTLDDYATALSEFVYQGSLYGPGRTVQQTLAGGNLAEPAPNDLTGYATAAYAANGPVFALMAVRMLVFSAVRFQYQRLRNGRPGDLFGDTSLTPVETPWTGGTTQDLLIRTILDADLAGNAYWTIQDGELVRLRPDWVQIVLEPRKLRGGILGYRRIGYIYTEQGLGGGDPVPLLPDEVAHFAPMPDPLASYRGMSWLTPVIRELTNDKQMLRHQSKFLENGATPNMVVSLDASIPPETFLRFKELLKLEHAGVENAYKTMLLGGGADATVVGSHFEQMAFTAVLGRGETRLAAAAGVPPTIVGFSEGLQGSSLNAGNYGQARRRFADATMHPLWGNAAGSFGAILKPPPGTRVWYDARDVPFLREDAKDAAEIQFRKSATIRQLVDAGYKPETVVAAVEAEDMSLLVHSGLYSVQLQPPGAQQALTAGSTPNAPSDGGNA